VTVYDIKDPMGACSRSRSKIHDSGDAVSLRCWRESCCRIVRRPKFLSWLRESEFCQFEVEGITFVVEEPFGDNSRYWIGPRPPRWVSQNRSGAPSLRRRVMTNPKISAGDWVVLDGCRARFAPTTRRTTLFASPWEGSFWLFPSKRMGSRARRRSFGGKTVEEVIVGTEERPLSTVTALRDVVWQGGDDGAGHASHGDVYQPFRECNSDELRIAPASQQLTRVGMELRMVSPDLKNSRELAWSCVWCPPDLARSRMVSPDLTKLNRSS